MKLAIRKLAMWIGAVSIAALAPLAQAANLVSNAGFETSGAGFPEVFTGWVDSGGTVVGINPLVVTPSDPLIVHSGSQSAAILGVSQGTIESLKHQLGGLNSASSYNFGFWVKCTNQTRTVSCDTDIFDVFLGGVLINRDSGGNSILSSLLSLAGSESGFDHYFGTVTPGIGASAFLDFQSNEYSNSVFLDDVLFEEVVACTGAACNVPEPGSLLLVGVALTAGAIVRRRRQR